MDNNMNVSQPAPGSRGQTVVTTSPTVEVKKDPGKVLLVKGGASLAEVVKAMKANGNRVISMDPLGWSLELVTAIAKAAKANGMITSFHLQPANTAVTGAGAVG